MSARTSCRPSTASSPRRRRGPGRASGPSRPTATSGRHSPRPATARLLFAPVADGEPEAALFLRPLRRSSRRAVRWHDRGRRRVAGELPREVGGDPDRRAKPGPTRYDLWGLAHPGIAPLQDRLRWPRGRATSAPGTWSARSARCDHVSPGPSTSAVGRGRGPRSAAVSGETDGLAAAAAPDADEPDGPRPAHDHDDPRGDDRRARRLGPMDGRPGRWSRLPVASPGPPTGQRLGWTARHLVFDDGFRRAVAGTAAGRSSAGLERVPVARTDRAARSRSGRRATRLRSAADWLARRRAIDVVAERPRDAGLDGVSGMRSRRARLRLDRRDPAVASPDARCRSGRASTRPTVFDGCRQVHPPADPRSGEGGDVAVVRHDARVGPDGDRRGIRARTGEPTEDALDRFYDLLLRDRRAAPLHVRAAGGVRRLVAGGPRGRPPRLPRGPRPDGGDPLAGLILYRHGGRLSTGPFGRPRVGVRRTHPGVAPPAALARHPARDRARGCEEMDLGGVDVAGARARAARGRADVRPLRSTSAPSAPSGWS